MKKRLKILSLILGAVFLLQGVSTSKESHAVVGVVSGNVPLIVVGSILATGGLPLTAFAIAVPAPGVFQLFLSTGLVAFVGGLVMLDDSRGGTPQFVALTREQQNQMGVSQEDYEVYESELEEIQAAIEIAARRVVVERLETSQEARVVFEREYQNLSESTRTVMKKIVSSVRNSGEVL
jgi:hypothetical protein